MELDDIIHLIVGNDNLNLKQIFFDASHPVDSTYVQYPQQKSPEDIFNKDGVTSTWQVIDYSGAFFRAEGGNAATFIKETDSLIKQSDTIKETSISVSGANHNHSGTTGTESNGHTHTRGTMEITGNFGNFTNTNWLGDVAGNGAFAQTDYGQRNYIDEGRKASDKGINFTASRSWTGSTSDISANHTHSFSTSWSDNLSMSGVIGNGNIETRPENYTIKIWKRIS